MTSVQVVGTLGYALIVFGASLLAGFPGFILAAGVLLTLTAVMTALITLAVEVTR